MADKNERAAAGSGPVVIKKYANRRLYNTETSTYVTLEDLAQMVRSDRDFVVNDAKSGDDLTHAVLTQIIVEQEGKAGGPSLLPVPFLRQLIRFYDDAVGKMVPSYLQYSMAALTKEQERYRSQFTNWGPNAMEAYQEQARKNLAMFEQAMSMWSPMQTPTSGAGQPPGSEQTPGNGATPPPTSTPDEEAAPQQAGNGHDQATAAAPDEGEARPTEIDILKAELAAMQERIERISKTT
ncbi:MAG: polyhydroxyalkanoate synthesis repressor PhaR [Pseudomonadota bacterium]